jgi:hypothetical protein
VFDVHDEYCADQSTLALSFIFQPVETKAPVQVQQAVKSDSLRGACDGLVTACVGYAAD